MRKENPRMDIATRKRYEKSRLFRFVVMEGVLTLDENSYLSGRGFYLYKDKEAIAIAKRKHLLSRYGKIDDEEAFFASLLEKLEGDRDD